MTNSSAEEPLIRVNWQRIMRIIKKITKRIIRIIEIVLIIFFKLLTRLTLITLWLYLRFRGIIRGVLRAFRNFSKRNIRGGWILLLSCLFLLAIGGILVAWARDRGGFADEIRQLKFIQQEINNSYQKKVLENEKQSQENKELQNKIKDLEKKLHSRQETAKKMAQRTKAEKYLPAEIKNIIMKYASIYKVDSALCKCIVFRESRGNPKAVGDYGAAIGACQYHLRTFLSHRRQMNLPAIDLREDPEESIQAMAWAISKGYGSAWTSHANCI